jgi:hypothetical protein
MRSRYLLLITALVVFSADEFRPATRAGEPVAIALSVQMSFTAR